METALNTMIERDWNSHPRLVDENGVLYVLKVSNFRQGKTADERMYDVSVASGPLYACHRGFTISVKKTNKTKFLRGIPYYLRWGRGHISTRIRGKVANSGAARKKAAGNRKKLG